MLASTATAEREGRAMVITAEAQVKAAELMRKAADMLSTDGAMQIRGLEVIERLAASPNAKVCGSVVFVCFYKQNR
jgi:erythrocyte band 7 integral membrane protein